MNSDNLAYLTYQYTVHLKRMILLCIDLKIKDLETKLQSSLNKLFKAGTDNAFTFSVPKNKFILFSKTKIMTAFNIRNGRNKIPEGTIIKFLGVTWDKRLN